MPGSKARALALGAAAIILSGTATVITMQVSGNNNISIKPAGTACGQCYSGKCGCVNITLTPYDPFTVRPSATIVAASTYQPTAQLSTITPAPRFTAVPVETLPAAPTSPSVALTPIVQATLGPVAPTLAPIATLNRPTDVPTALPATAGPTATPDACLGFNTKRVLLTGEAMTVLYSNATPFTNVALDSSPPGIVGVYVNVVPAYVWTFSAQAPATPGVYVIRFKQNGDIVQSCNIYVARLDPTLTAAP